MIQIPGEDKYSSGKVPDYILESNDNTRTDDTYCDDQRLGVREPDVEDDGDCNRCR